ncbi:glutamine-hydrolyzing GMP synthase [Candidatus Woesearchaeota archaeon]|nr:glutamine-hydrolyzing GMP synthase [Candidatus Woesearchaeota archaeon]
MTDKIIILDFGSQYTHLLARRVRELNVFSEILPPEVTKEQIEGAKGIILSGGPASVYDQNSPTCPDWIFELEIPILGLCYGHQLFAQNLGGEVSAGTVKEYGLSTLDISLAAINNENSLFTGIEKKQIVWMSHGDTVSKLPKGFYGIANTSDCQYAAMENIEKKRYGLQFHPEVTHTKNGMLILSNFVLKICKCLQDWDYEHYVKQIEDDVIHKVGDKNVFLLVSGGVDSSVCFTLLNKLLGKDRVFGLHVDTGLMRKNESKVIVDDMRKMGYDNLHVVDASSKFLAALHGKFEPEEKRKIIGNMFVTVQREELDIQNFDPDKWMLAQGTIYPDTIEAGGTKNSDVIKTHHNRVPIIEKMIEEGKVIEPIKELYKDEVRTLGERIGMAPELINRHPFPGPGLGIRILCTEKSGKGPEISELKEIAKKSGFQISVLNIKSVGVQGDNRTYRHPAVLMSDNPDWDKMIDLSTRITNEIHDINRVVYLLNKPSGKLSEYKHSVYKHSEFMLHPAYIIKDRVSLLQEADDIVNKIIIDAGLYDEIWQMPVCLIPIGEGTNESIVLRPIVSKEAMTADVFRMPQEVLDRIIDGLSKLDGIDHIFYDITNKPPGTIEWE